MKYIGIVLIILGSLLLIASYFFFPEMRNNNLYTFGSLGIITAGIVAHVLVNKGGAK